MRPAAMPNKVAYDTMEQYSFMEAKGDEWFFWEDHAHSPAENMAIDEALLLSSPQRGRSVLRIYDWAQPSVSIGYVQRWDAAPRGKIFVRRPTGGGVVFHGLDITYTVVIPPSHWICNVDRIASYGHINDAIRSGLALCDVNAQLSSSEIPRTVDRSTMVCFTNPTRYDVMDGGKKIAGSAQRRTRDGILHQGSIVFDASRSLLRTELVNRIVQGFTMRLGANFSNFKADAALLRLELELVKKYSSDEWNKRR